VSKRFSNLAAESFRRLYEGYEDLLKNNEGCQRSSKVPEGCWRMPEAVGGLCRLPMVVDINQRLTKGYRRSPKAARGGR